MTRVRGSGGPQRSPITAHGTEGPGREGGTPTLGHRRDWRGMSSFDPDTRTSWLAPEDLDLVRDRVPMVYVQAVPVRLDDAGIVTHIGLLLRVLPDGSI